MLERKCLLNDKFYRTWTLTTPFGYFKHTLTRVVSCATAHFNIENLGILSSKKIKWIFNPPEAPFFCGIWEAVVRSTNHHLSNFRNLEAHLWINYYILHILGVILNIRPLRPIASDPNDGDLTPGLFTVSLLYWLLQISTTWTLL